MRPKPVKHNPQGAVTIGLTIYETIENYTAANALEQRAAEAQALRDEIRERVDSYKEEMNEYGCP